MAGSDLPQGTSVQANLTQLDQHLEENFNMPTSQWWESAGWAFAQLQELSRPRSGAALDQELDEPSDEYAASARLARAASLPAVIVLPSRNYALGLTATNEPLQCVAFGTVGRKRYIELFWESIARAQEAGVPKIAVYEVLQLDPKIALRIESHVFELRYHQCEALVRTYPNILDAPVSFLTDSNYSNDIVKQEVEILQQERKLYEKFKNYPDVRRAYYYKRAWAIAWGLFNSSEEARVMFYSCDGISLEDNGDFASIVSKFVEQWNLYYPHSLEYQSSDWDHRLSQIEAEPLCKKFVYPYYLQVTILYTGSSSIKGGEWISMVKRRLEFLRSTLNSSIPGPTQTSSPMQRFRVWPQRLVRHNADPGDGVYEGSFVVGLDIQESTLSTATQVAERWKLGIDADDLTIQDQCFIDIVISQGNSEIAKQDLKPCTRIWPRPIMKGDEGSKEPRTLKLSKREKREIAKELKDQGTIEMTAEAPKSTKKLRPASDVLGRLRYGGDYDIDEFVVGYKDRHSSRLMEKPAVQWAKDTTSEEFIPEHRIEYFKRYKEDGADEVLWDKSSRLDKIFQHGGSG